MFDPSPKPRVFGLAPGVDFPAELIRGLTGRVGAGAPEALARVHLILNTRRMARRVRELFDSGPPRLLPRISLVTEPGENCALGQVAPAVPPLRRRLELAVLIENLLDRQPDLAARSSLFDLADSLANLIDEMQGEGVAAETILGLDVTDMSGHWQRSQAFFAIVERYLRERGGDSGLDPQARLRLVVETLIAAWSETPPQHPVILAGSTGSRGTTRLLMEAVARLPQGAVILPGFDFDMPASVWSDLDTALLSEDHPQYRFRKLMQTLDIAPPDIARWSDASPPSPARNRLVSLALRPAPVTDAWMREGPQLHDLAQAAVGMTLVEAPTPRTEALAIALRLRQAAEDGQKAALITPDRMLTRQVSAALDRWNIVADDSAGVPLHLSPPGRFLRQVAQLFVRRLSSETLLALLKHPLCHAGGGRGNHLLCTRDLELHLRRKGPPFPDADSMQAYGAGNAQVPEDWLAWLIDGFCDRTHRGRRDLSAWIGDMRGLAEDLAAGSRSQDSSPLWDQNAGQKALSIIEVIEAEAAFAGPMSAQGFADMLGSVLAGEEVRDRDAPHDGIMIWGTLEARVQGADLLILGGLNDGTWPEPATPDPWLNRALRDAAGLLLPERRIGLSAHDFQQAVAAREVWLTRSLRSEEAETVASRWLNRMTNLLEGLAQQGGADSLKQMRARGQNWLAWADKLEEAPPLRPVPRPSPRPPASARPRSLSITEIKRLIRDPYAIYAKHVLRLRPLDPLVQAPDALLRGIVVHEILENFVRESGTRTELLTRERFLQECRAALDRLVPWPTARLLWLARLERIADDFLKGEMRRRNEAAPAAFEAETNSRLDPLDFTLTGRADRIDRNRAGELILYDYKTGRPPTGAEQAKFEKQLLIEAAIAERGGFKDVPAAPVAKAVFLAVGGSGKDTEAPLDKEPPAKIWAELGGLISTYLDPGQGFTSRRMVQKESDAGDYDQLARFGEWDQSSVAVPEDLT